MKSVIEISAERLVGNVAALREATGPGCELLGVIKADAYGHGAGLCARVLAGAGVRWLGVGDTEEGRRVREALRPYAGQDAGFAAPHLLVMCGFEPADATEIVAAQLTPVVWTPEHLDALERAQGRLPHGGREQLAVHLEIDSGMARQGVAPGVALAAFLSKLRSCPSLRCEGVFSHLSSSEVPGAAETTVQTGRFAEALGQVKAAGLQPEFVHLGNSSAVDEGHTLAWVWAQAAALGARPMVRPGLALYGHCLRLAGAPQSAGDLAGHLAGNLRPVASWTVNITGLREIAAGEPVGYGATFRAKEPMRLALLPVGYADGLRREASSGLGDGWVMIAGRRAPVVGRVSMNLTVADVTSHRALGLPVALGTQAVLLGEGVSAQDHADWACTIPYEILCGLRGHRRLGLSKR